jgi:hypothetical protein
MKAFKISLLFTCLTLSAIAQKFRPMDKSTMDIAYYPDDFAHDRKYAPQKVGDKAFVRVTYTRPAKKEREIFGKLIPYGNIWRMGANEATEIKFYQDVIIDGKTVKAGVYSMFAIPNENEWEFIFNSELDVWGNAQYKQENDVFRFKAVSKKSDEVIENLSIVFTKNDEKSTTMHIGWDTTVASFLIKY